MGEFNNAGSKQGFFDWLSTRNENKYPPSVVVSCIDKISEYAINKKIYYTDFWYITRPSDFEDIYAKFLNSIMRSTMDRSTYKTFIDVGQLYLNFLGEKLSINVSDDADFEGMPKSVTPLSESTAKQAIFQSERHFDKQARNDINPEALIAWLITQPNANGTLYLERVVRQYISCLRYAPGKLDLPYLVNRNVFSCQTVEELNSLWEVFRSAPNYKDVNQRSSGQFSAGLSCLSRYLEHLSGSQENPTTPAKSSGHLPNVIQKIQEKSPVQSPILVDFDRPGQCAQMQPVSCTIYGQTIVPNKLNWSKLLVAITERFITEGNPYLAELDMISLYGSKAFFLPRKPDYGTSALLSNHKWISTNYPPQIIVVIIRNLCRHCGIELDSVSIAYVPKNPPIKWSANRLIHGNTSTPDLASPKLDFEAGVLKAVSDVLLAHFPNGFRADSPIELMRFRSYAAVNTTDPIQLVDEDLEKAIRLCGTLFEGKVYVVGKETESRLMEEVDAAVVRGAEVIFYTSFYALHESWLFPGSVISEDMLKEMLKTLYPAYHHKANYFSTKKNNVAELPIIQSEILRIWNGDILLNYEQISARLPYIPLDKIKYGLALNDGFIWNSPEVYTHIGMLDISAEERANIEDYVAAACRKVGFVSMSEVPLGKIAEHNYELTITAIHTAVFVIVLSGKYERRDKIITRKGDSLDALTILKDHCRSIDNCSFQDLVDLERDLTGDSYPWIALEAGCAVLVRIAEDAFVAEKYVHFDVDGIDATLDLFVTGQYLPIKSVTTFVTFPYCGQVWNPFLLESYCRRFSRRFRFDGLTMNSRNAGTIIRKSCGLAYAEIMVNAVAASGVELKKTNVVEFLRSHGYIGRRFYARVGELIEQAKTLREKRN